MACARTRALRRHAHARCLGTHTRAASARTRALRRHAHAHAPCSCTRPRAQRKARSRADSTCIPALHARPGATFVRERSCEHIVVGESQGVWPGLVFGVRQSFAGRDS
eukprot:1545428-Pleurochrysis_carterae.AAC.1